LDGAIEGNADGNLDGDSLGALDGYKEGLSEEKAQVDSLGGTRFSKVSHPREFPF